MQLDELTDDGARQMSVCNACRYCEQYCPVFQAMEQRVSFASADLNYLANLCHNCGECLYACQYAPPHEFAIDVPRTLSRIRVRSYEQYAWPAAFAGAFRRNSTATALWLACAMVALLSAATFALNRGALLDPGTAADFYAVVPHAVLATLFGGVGLFVLTALGVGIARCWRDLAASAVPMSTSPPRRALGRALHDAASLRHLHVNGTPCVTAREVRTPWRRLFHHATAYGFVLCFASTCVAALYHFNGSPAPYDYTSLPVVLGTLGGIGLTVGPVGQWVQRRRRDPALSATEERQLDGGLLVLLLLTALTGLLLLALRAGPSMGILLVIHLGIVLALFVTLPYGKLVHGLYRAAALLKYRREEGAEARHSAAG